MVLNTVKRAAAISCLYYTTSYTSPMVFVGPSPFEIFPFVAIPVTLYFLIQYVLFKKLAPAAKISLYKRIALLFAVISSFILTFFAWLFICITYFHRENAIPHIAFVVCVSTILMTLFSWLIIRTVPKGTLFAICFISIAVTVTMIFLIIYLVFYRFWEFTNKMAGYG